MPVLPRTMADTAFRICRKYQAWVPTANCQLRTVIALMVIVMDGGRESRHSLTRQFSQESASYCHVDDIRGRDICETNSR